MGREWRGPGHEARCRGLPFVRGLPAYTHTRTKHNSRLSWTSHAACSGQRSRCMHWTAGSVSKTRSKSDPHSWCFVLASDV